LYGILVLAVALSTTHTWTAVAFFSAGCAIWTLVEYLFHRYVLHGRFPPGKGIVRRFLHERLDPLHWDHHKRPFDGSHISGELKDILPLFFVVAPFSFLFPVYTAPVVLAGVVQSYVSEEWLHYALHFSTSRFPSFGGSRNITCTTTAPVGSTRALASPLGSGTECSILQFPEAVAPISEQGLK